MLLNDTVFRHARLGLGCVSADGRGVERGGSLGRAGDDGDVERASAAERSADGGSLESVEGVGGLAGLADTPPVVRRHPPGLPSRTVDRTLVFPRLCPAYAPGGMVGGIPVARPEERHFLGFRRRLDPHTGTVEVLLSERINRNAMEVSGSSRHATGGAALTAASLRSMRGCAAGTASSGSPPSRRCR